MNARMDGWILPPFTSGFWDFPAVEVGVAFPALLIGDLVVPDWGGEVERDFGSGRDLIWGLLRDASCNISLNSLAIVSSFLETTKTEWIYKNKLIDI